MRVVDRIDIDHRAGLVAIRLDARVDELRHHAVEFIGRGRRVVVDPFAPEVHHVGTRVRDTPRHRPRETDRHARQSGNRRPANLQAARYHDVHFIPDARQRELEMRITGQQRVTVGRARWRDRPVVAGERAGLLDGGVEILQPRQRRHLTRVFTRTFTRAQRRHHARGDAVGSARCRNRRQRHSRRAAIHRLDRLLHR